MRSQKPQPQSERREAPRFSVVLPVKLEQGEGWTRDVSTGGVFFTTQGALSSGERIRFTLVLEHVDPNGALAIPCEAKWSASSHSTPDEGNNAMESTRKAVSLGLDTFPSIGHASGLPMLGRCA